MDASRAAEKKHPSKWPPSIVALVSVYQKRRPQGHKTGMLNIERHQHVNTSTDDPCYDTEVGWHFSSEMASEGRAP